MFRFTGYVMLFAPIGVGAAMAHTVGTQGLGVLVNLGKLIGSLYLALILFIVLVLQRGGVLCRIPIGKFLKAVREPATIAFATTSSESALPKAMEMMERLGVPPRIVGFVMPTGYSFNLDGTTLYLAMASVFVAQAAEATTRDSTCRRPADSHDADADADLEGRGGGAPRLAGHPVRHARHLRAKARGRSAWPSSSASTS